MNFNFSPNQAAQGANYAGRAMNAFQTAVNIDNQQPQPEGTTFGFRWLIRVVAVVSGLREFSIKNKYIFFIHRFLLVAIICGIFGALSISPFCIIAGVLMMFVYFFILITIDLFLFLY
jgi:hypothetical protein